ncbi:aldehyde dehydrogenase family protein [Streptomyces sp. WM6386]|uniref:aldehyde dehydrogenase family protein n=1 Tax=Streptomyces sp. WM6386 TaxID=1415558 RepID=UPI000619684E|nr:aldehyde dehydrogenase family protein [Streptomyces sp. WM6386]KKD09198.1 hypothetical protein TN53_03575 [Streptomyces sp. WM6386]
MGRLEVDPSTWADGLVRVISKVCRRPVRLLLAADKGVQRSVDGTTGLPEQSCAAREVARKIRSGTVSINNGITIDLGVPFGGVKQSGTGVNSAPRVSTRSTTSTRSSSTASRS